MNAHRVAALLLLAWIPLVQAAAPAGLDLVGMDAGVAPDENFFKYANGSWLKKTKIPADRSSTGVGRDVQEMTDKRVRELIEGAARGKPAPGSDAQRIGDYFASYMDAAGIEAKGLQPLQAQLVRIAAIADRKQLASLLGSTLRADVDVLNATDLYTPNVLGVWVAQDLDDPSRYSAFLLQGGLSMPDREYYLDGSAPMVEVRGKFTAHVARIFTLAGFDQAEARAARVFELERSLAQAHTSRAETEDVARGNTHWRADEFAAKAPGLDWRALFEAAGLSGQDRFVVWQPGAVTGLARLAGEAPLESWKDLLAFHLIDGRSPFLPKAFVDENFAFYDHVLSGTPQIRTRWKRGVEFINEVLGDTLGRLYVQRWFPAEDKARAEAMVHDLIAAFGRRIDSLAWMAPETRARAKAKLAVLIVGVGYPDRWRDDSGLSIVRGDAVGNQDRAELFDYQRSLKKLGTPVDRSEWVMNPQLVNAVNLPAMNAMNFPAAILQPPYFDGKRNAAMNYGAIGSVIGHEISHSFDDQGALFDDRGRLHNWWTPADFDHFRAAGQQLVAQYDAYRPLPDMAIKGQQVLSENIADLAGLAVAYDAWQLSLGGKPAPVVQGLTGEQQFFISFAQSWRSKQREPLLRQRLLTDGHSPAEFRVATVRNLDAFYAAFKTAPGHAQYLAPAERVRVW